MRLLYCVIFAAISTMALAQDKSAASVYSESKDSVFLIYLNDAQGKPQAFGTAFLVAPGTLVTNNHVIDGGMPVLSVGPVKIPLKVLRIDKEHDHALLGLAADVSTRPLALASSEPAVGDHIYAIGNPEGLEKTISEGIVSSIRREEGIDLLQITSPISHGSSGGPILNTHGEVVGVAVAMMKDGQNLNFAVPLKFVSALIKEPIGTTPSATESFTTLFTKLNKSLDGRRGIEYSEDSSSPYQRQTAEIESIRKSLLSAASRESDFRSFSCIGISEYELDDLTIDAAKKLVERNGTADNQALLSYVLFQRALLESAIGSFAKAGSNEAREAENDKDKFLTEADDAAARAQKSSKDIHNLLATYVQGGVKGERNLYAEAITFYKSLVDKHVSACGTDLNQLILRDLIAFTANIKSLTDSEFWFRHYSTEYSPSPSDWDSEGDRLVELSKSVSAADAYEKAAGANEGFGYDYCYAATNLYGEGQTFHDRILDDGHKCINSSVGKNDDHATKLFTAQLPEVYRTMANILQMRGVDDQALTYAKEALSADPNDYRALGIEGDIFEDLQRYSECISAEQAAIRLSEGKFTWMHFRLGSCYFATEDWHRAAANFRISAESDKSDPSAAFNLGLSLERQGFEGDAKEWFHEALNRKPDTELRNKILRALQ